MTPRTRREFGRFLLFSLGASVSPSVMSTSSAKPNSMINGVQIGIQSYSFRDRPFDAMVEAIAEVGINSCELWSGHLEPKGLDDIGRTRWRLTSQLSLFEEARRKFLAAGIEINAYYYDIRKEMSDDEIERGFLMAKTLGTNVITSSSNPSMAKRVDLYAQKYKMSVGMHNHPQEGKTDEFEGAHDFAAAMQNCSRYICVCLDVGHFVAAGFDPVEYISRNHSRIVILHLKDRKRGLGRKSATLRFGSGDTPIKEVLQLLKENKYKIPANIEHEINGQSPLEGVKQSLEYCKKVLA